jgi:hypothetical protein
VPDALAPSLVVIRKLEQMRSTRVGDAELRQA